MSTHSASPQAKAQFIRSLKNKRKVTMITAYDYPTARLLDEAGVDSILVGDSLGMMVLGFPDTTHVELRHVVHHVEAVSRGVKMAQVVADVPIGTFDTIEQTLQTAQTLMQAGADAVKIEGGVAQEVKIAAVVASGIPVVGHIGMLPQQVLLEGGYHVKGRTQDEAALIHADLAAVLRAGACCVVIEGVKADVARQLTAESTIPTIGIGSGAGTCDGAVVVINDLVGSFPWFVPGFIKPRENFAARLTQVARDWMNGV